MSERLVRASEDGTLLDLRVSPGAKRNSVEGIYGETAIRLKVSAPPVDGKANSEIERFVAGLLGALLAHVSVVKGVSGRNKTVLVRGAKPDEIQRSLAELPR